MARYFIRSSKNWEFMEISEEEARKQKNVFWLEDMPGEFWAVRGYYREEGEKMNKYQKKQASLRKKGIEKERFFIRNEGRKWEYVEISEAEAWKQENVIFWEEEEPGEWWAVYREDFLI